MEVILEEFFAQRGKAKALILQSLCFDKYIVGAGILFGWTLKMQTQSQWISAI